VGNEQENPQKMGSQQVEASLRKEMTR
jgi:hypothetical protein